MIVPKGSKYVAKSHTTGRSFGTYSTRAQAEKRLRQMKYWKHIKGGR